MNPKRIFKDLKSKIKKHKLTSYGISKFCRESGEPLIRQTIDNILKIEDGLLGNVCVLIGAVDKMIENKTKK